MNRRTAIRQMATFILTTASCAHAQQPKKVFRTGYLSPFDSTTDTTHAALMQPLRDLGNVTDKKDLELAEGVKRKCE